MMARPGTLQPNRVRFYSPTVLLDPPKASGIVAALRQFTNVARGLALAAIAAIALTGCADSDPQGRPAQNQAEAEEHEPPAEQAKHEAEARKEQAAREEAEANRVTRKVLREEKAEEEGRAP